MANGRNGPISNALLLADKDNETAKELAPTLPHQEGECTAQGMTSKRKIVIMDRAQASSLNVGLHYLTNCRQNPQDLRFLKKKCYSKEFLLISFLFMQLMANGHNGSISRAVLLVEKENVTAHEPVPTQPP